MQRKRSLILLALFLCSYGEVSEAWKYEIDGNQWLGVEAGWNDEVTAKGDVWMDLKGIFGNEAAVYASSNGKIDLSGYNTSIKIKGTGVVGAYAKDKNSSIKFSGSVAVEGKGSHGIYADSGTIESEGTVSATGDEAIGVYAENEGAKVHHKGDILVKGNHAVGISAYGAGSEVFVEGNTQVIGDNSYGIDGAFGKVTVIGNITTQGKSSHGIYSYSLAPESHVVGPIVVKGIVTTEGDKSHGAYAHANGSSIDIEGGIVTKGIDSYGIYVDHQKGAVNFDGGISTIGENSYGVRAELGNVNIGERFPSSVVTEGERAHGLYVSEAQAKISGNIKTTGNQAIGILLDHDKSEVIGDGIISTSDENSYGIRAELGKISWGTNSDIESAITTTGDEASGIYASGAKVEMNGIIQTSGENSHGIWTDHLDSDVDFSGVIVTGKEKSHGVRAELGSVNIGTPDGNSAGMILTEGENAHGIYASEAKVDMTGIIATDGDFANGIFVDHVNGEAHLRGAIFTEGANAHGVHIVEGKATVSGEEDEFGIDSTIYTMGDSSLGIWNQGGEAQIKSNVITEGNYSYGVRNENGELDLKGSVMTVGEGSHGVYSSGGNVKIASDTLVSATGEKAYGIYADQGAQIQLEGSATISSSLQSDSYAIRAERGLVPQINSINGQNTSRITGEGQFFITGGISAGDGGDIRLNFKEGSGFEGITEVESGGYLEINMKDTYWKVTGDSYVSHLSLTGGFGSVVDFRSDAPIGTELVIDNYEKADNRAVFALRTDIATGASDKVIVTDSELDPHTNLMYVEDITTGRIDGTEVITMARIEGNHEECFFGLSTIDGEEIDMVDSGGFRYGLVKDQSNWNLKGTGGASTTASASVNTFAGAYLLSYAENQTLMQRLGDLRNDPSSSGVWFKVHGGEFESRSGSIFDDFKMKYWGVQAGIDKKISSKNKKSDIYIGGMFGYSKGDLDYDSHGSGTIEAKTLGLYGTYKRESGFYADLLLKYMWMDNEFDVINLQGGTIHGDEMSTDGFGASLEIGKRFHFDSKSRSGWYVEPQAQISYLRQNSGDFYASNGLHVNVDSYTSLLGRVGTNIGYEIKSGKNPVNVYAKASYVYEFDGDVGAKLNGEGVKASFGDSWWTYGIGITAKVGTRHNVYLDLERATGGQFKQPWSLNGGYRYSW